MAELGIEYPCEWSYTLIGPDENEMRKAAKFAFGEKDHKFIASHRSSGGEYQSFLLTLIVDDEAERLAIFELLKHDAAVKMLI